MTISSRMGRYKLQRLAHHSDGLSVKILTLVTVWKKRLRYENVSPQARLVGKY
jgi:hypothetical protein